MNIEQAVAELRAQNKRDTFDVLQFRPPSDDFYRVVEHKGETFKVCLTKITLTEGKKLWMLSIAKPSGKPNEYGAYLPKEDEAVEIAQAFFPNGCTALTDQDQLIKMTCRKFITLEKEEQK
jgi:hypothetical protein